MLWSVAVYALQDSQGSVASMRAHLSCRSFIARLAHTRQFVAEPLDCSQIKFPDLAGEDIQREQPQERKTNQKQSAHIERLTKPVRSERDLSMFVKIRLAKPQT